MMALGAAQRSKHEFTVLQNYELNIIHVKEEDFEHFTQLEALRKQLSEVNTAFQKAFGLL